MSATWALDAPTRGRRKLWTALAIVAAAVLVVTVVLKVLPGAAALRLPPGSGTMVLRASGSDFSGAVGGRPLTGHMSSLGALLGGISASGTFDGESWSASGSLSGAGLTGQAISLSGTIGPESFSATFPATALEGETTSFSGRLGQQSVTGTVEPSGPGELTVDYTVH